MTHLSLFLVDGARRLAGRIRIRKHVDCDLSHAARTCHHQPSLRRALGNAATRSRARSRSLATKAGRTGGLSGSSSEDHRDTVMVTVT